MIIFLNHLIYRILFFFWVGILYVRSSLLYLQLKALGLPFLSPYLKSIGSDFRHGANFSSSASTVLQPTTSLDIGGISPFHLSIKFRQLHQFKARVSEFHQQGKSNQNSCYKLAYGLCCILQNICVLCANSHSNNTTQEERCPKFAPQERIYLHRIYLENPFIRSILAKMTSLRN